MIAYLALVPFLAAMALAAPAAGSSHSSAHTSSHVTTIASSATSGTPPTSVISSPVVTSTAPPVYFVSLSIPEGTRAQALNATDSDDPNDSAGLWGGAYGPWDFPFDDITYTLETFDLMLYSSEEDAVNNTTPTATLTCTVGVTATLTSNVDVYMATASPFASPAPSAPAYIHC